VLYVVDRFPVVSETFVVREVRELHRRGELAGVYGRRAGDAAPAHAGADEVAALVRLRPRRPAIAAAMARTLVAAPLRTLRALAWALVQRRHERGLFEAFGDACLLRTTARDAGHVHAHFAHWPASVAVLTSLLSAVPCSFTTHARDLFEARPGGLRRKVAAAHAALTVSEHTRTVLSAAATSADAARIHVVRNGVERPLVRPGRPPARTPPLVLTVGRLVEKKGIDVVVDACARSRTAADWLVIGDGPLRDRLERRAGVGGGGRLRFAGAVDDRTVAAALDEAAVFVLPCRIAADGDRDALPVALVEALAHGVPVVSTAIAGIPEVVEDGVSGLLVAPDDPGAVARAVDRLLADAELHARLRDGALAAAERFDLDRCIADLRRHLRAA
jgi:glycosyltransferase involved in cell wall biosynthesis